MKGIIARQTAKKVTIASLVTGRWVKKEGMEPSFIETSRGEQVSRARIMGTVVSCFVADDKEFASISVDDATETIRLKTFKTAKPLDTIAQGQVVDAIGKVREWNGEIYMIPEIVHVVTNPNLELLRRIELAGTYQITDTPVKEDPKLRDKALELIGAQQDGISFDNLLAALGGGPEAEAVINDLLGEGVCYEPTPGMVKKI